MIRRLLIVPFAILMPLLVAASDHVMISQWLLTPPLEVNYPAFHETPNVQGEPFSDRQLLIFDHIDLAEYFPEEGKVVKWIDGHSHSWRAEHTDADGFVLVSADGAGDRPEIAYLATYIRTDRWMKAQLELNSPWLFEAWLNGQKIGTKSTVERPAVEEGPGEDAEAPALAPSGATAGANAGANAGATVGATAGATAAGAALTAEASLLAEAAFATEAALAADGQEEALDAEDSDARSGYGRIRHEMSLPRGTHLLVVKMLRPPTQGAEWELRGSVRTEEPFDASDFQVSTSPETIKDILHFMDGVKVSSVRPSPDGTMYAVSYRQSLPPSDRWENWTDIRRFSDGGLVHSFRHASVSRLGWLPNTNALSYTTVQNGRTTLHWHHMETGEKRVLMEDVADFAGFSWSPDESFIIYTIREQGSGTDATMRHILGMQDRQAHFRNRSFLYKLDIASGVRTRLTHGNVSTSLQDISPDGCCFVFSQSRPDYLERPFLRTDYFMMSLHDLSVDTLIANKSWGVSLRFSPDGWYLLATGPAMAFGGIGENIPEGMIANSSDTQAYIFSLTDRSVKPITFDFDPTVSSVYWHKGDNNIYMVVGEEDYRYLYRYNVRRERFEQIDTGIDYLSTISYASGSSVATYVGNDTNAPPRAYRMDLRNERYSVLEDPDAERYRHVRFGEVYDWDFTASTGVEVTGRVYLPPGFDEEQSYPVIVYQYGGTTPVGRTFGHRYPFNLWAGNGYVVYVMQPSGAIGYGQAFSAAHVNNWGITVVDEIIEGTEQFLQAHPFTDPDRVGLAGASYGGFMTMLVVSHTDLFATGISHAGISNIASYWGEGYWGYTYSASATAYSFPWNRKDIYIDQSPLYRADHINTPLLLLTGDSDTNVPPGESIQMYTALKLLDRPVELILVEGEDHHILTYSKRLKWHDAIMAWWDKHLKGQPEWWEEQYPVKNY